MKYKIEQPDYLIEYIVGFSDKEKYSVFLEGKNYAIIKFSGGSFWSGIKTSYCPPFYTLIKKYNGDYWKSFSKQIHEGRINKIKKQELKDILNQYDKLNGEGL